MNLSIIIISYNTKELLSQCLKSVFDGLRDVSFSYEVIVYDNASHDGSSDMVEKEYPKARLIQKTTNNGFGKGNNEAIAISKGERVLLLNSDTVIVGAALEKLYEFSLRHKHAFVAPKLLNKDRSPQASCGPFFTLPVVFAVLFLRGDRWGLTRWSPNKVQRVDWASGAALMGEREVFLDDLLFDEKIFMYMEEIDLQYRAKQRGIFTYMCPASSVIHVGSASSKDKKKTPILSIYRGFLYFYKKHYSPSALFTLKLFLKLKAITAIIVATVLRDHEVQSTYVEAFRMV